MYSYLITSYWVNPNKFQQAVTVPTYIQQVPEKNVGLDAWFFSFSPDE
jgi:hypothetical protein